MGREHHGDRKCRALCFDPPTCQECLAHTNWDGGIRSYTGDAQEECQKEPSRPASFVRYPAAAETDGPTLSPKLIADGRGVAAVIEFPDKRFQWVMNFDAFREKTQRRPVYHAGARPFRCSVR